MSNILMQFINCQLYFECILLLISNHHLLQFSFRELLHTRNRQDETCERLNAVLRDSCTSCELQLAGPEYEYNQGISSLSPALAEELELSDNQVRSQALTPDMTKLKKANVAIDNYLSPAHTLVQIRCADHKGLLYDIMRTLKDLNMKVLFSLRKLFVAQHPLLAPHFPSLLQAQCPCL